VDQQGTGLDVDVCRAIAAALFDDPEAVDFVISMLKNDLQRYKPGK